MNIKSILCAYSGDGALGSGLAHAIKLADHHTAHLTGVLRHGRPMLEQRFAAQVPTKLLEQLHQADTDHIIEVKGRFNKAVAGAGLEGQSKFVELDPATDGPLTEFARGFDLVVTGVHSEAANEAHLTANPDMIALKSGRPVLVVPNGYAAKGLAERALVAWDGKRSAARAIGDAMAILESKAGVTLLSVGKTPRGTAQLIENMQRHGIDVTARTVKKKHSISDTILAEAETTGSGLIVMGAYEHSKFAHDLMGGVTTDVIRDTRVPVFMSH
ncbi:MAG: universal stress protein [Octadecabacter sp.]